MRIFPIGLRFDLYLRLAKIAAEDILDRRRAPDAVLVIGFPPDFACIFGYCDLIGTQQ